MGLSTSIEKDGARRPAADDRIVSSGFRASGPRSDSRDRDPRVHRAVNAAKAGDREALRFLYVHYADNVYGYVLSLVKDEHAAEDVTQQVFLKLMTVIEKYEPREVPFAAWIVRVARNVALDHLRARRQIPCAEVFGSNEESDRVADDRRTSLKVALATLPPDQRNVVVLRHLAGLTPGEIARRMGRTDASIHGLHHRARQALRDELERLQAAPAVS